MESKFNWKFLLLYMLAVILIFVFAYPSIFICFIAQLIYPEVILPGWHLLNWGWCLRGDFFNIAAAACFLWVAGAVACYTMIAEKGHSVGTEHGSARFLTDKEFDALVPNYDLHKNEYEHVREDSDDTSMVYLKTSDVNIFEDIDFVSDKEVHDGENKEC